METPITVDANSAELPPSAQPQLSGNILDMEAQIKAASDAAQARGEDPSRLPIGILAEEVPNVPKKFVTPTGEVDVEKLKASTERLNEEIQKKESVVQKSVEDYLQAEKKFRTLPNAAKIEQKIVAPAQEVVQQPIQMSRDQLEARINADMQANPAATVASLIDIMFDQKFGQKIAPLEQGIQVTLQRERDDATRANLKSLAERDPRIMNQEVFDAINAKLAEQPKFWELKNPHKAAWLEVKDEMRLGDTPQGGSAQPSRPPSPILGGGTPPPPQSSTSGALNYDSVSAAMAQANFKDSNQSANLEKSMKALADAEWRTVR